MHPVGVNMLARARNLACAMMALVLAAPASAQDYPNRAVTLLVPQAPGASSDALARIAARAVAGGLGPAGHDR